MAISDPDGFHTYIILWAGTNWTFHWKCPTANSNLKKIAICLSQIYHYKILHMSRQLCCRDMCKNL